MRQLIASVLIGIFVLAGFGPAHAETWIMKYDITVNVSDSESMMKIATDFPLRFEPPTDHVDLVFSSSVGSLELTDLSGAEEVKLATTRKGNDTLSIEVPAALRESGTLVVHMTYTWPRQPGSDVVYLSRGYRWYPQILDEIVPYTLYVNLPAQYTTVSGGDLTSMSTLLDEKQMIWESTPVFKIELAILKQPLYKDGSIDTGGIEFHFVSSREATGAGRVILDQAYDQVSYMTDLMGEYPFSRLTILEIGEFEGTNIGSGILVMGTPAVDALFKGYRDELRLAIAAQWIGAGAFPKFMSKGFWFLQLSMPHYLRLMYEKAVDGDSVYARDLDQTRAAYQASADTASDVAIMDIKMPDSKAKSTAIYGKGPNIIRTVAEKLGEEEWGHFLRELYSNYKGRTLTVEDFQSILVRYDRTGAVSEYLRRALTSKGLPE